ncbi:glycosyltransferase [Lysobacter korlensis]|uniref:Glycosyltransferase n=1 Tax=Lysobacter korlensis TaxID=553636 RepID=A0ABV6RZ03_9GAMM
MANIVFLTLDGGGNVPPAVAIARELDGRGHRVRFLGAETQRHAISAAGFDFRAYTTPTPWLPAEPLPPLAELRSIVRLIGGRGYATDLAADLREEPADAVVIDALIAGSVRAALPLGVPVVVLMHSLAQFFLTSPVPKLAGRLHGFSAITAWASAAAVLVVTDPQLDAAAGKAPGNFVWTGAAELPPAAPAVPASPPRVLVSLSTVGAPGQRNVMQRILDAVAPLPLEAIVTTGRRTDPATLTAGSNTTLHRELPHHEVLPTCSAVIGHGGHSTTMRALMHGLPTVLIPCDTRIDQPLVAKSVAGTGAGIALPKRAKPDRIRAAVEQVLREPSYRAAAAALGERLRAENGPAAAADVVLRVARREPGSPGSPQHRIPGRSVA